jgi:hypothetical protein
MTAATSDGMLRRTNSRKYTYFLSVMFCLPWLRCLEHVVNLANVAVMGHITKIAVIENTNTIWEYDPELPNNRVLGGSLDVVAAIRTLAIKVCTSTIKPDLIIWYSRFSDRFKLPDSASSTSRNCRSNARSPPHSRFCYTVGYGT